MKQVKGWIMMKKMNKKLAGAVVLGLMLAVPVGASAADIETVNGDIKVTGGNTKNYTCKELYVNSHNQGIMALEENSKITIDVNTLNVESSGYFSVHVGNNTELSHTDPAYNAETVANVDIKADNIYIKNTKYNTNDRLDTGMGISAYSNGIMNVNGNLVVEAHNALDVRGNSTVNINTDGAHSTVINGDIVFETPNSPGDAQNSGKLINSKVNINFNGEGSQFNGRAFQCYKGNDNNVELNKDPYHGNVADFKMQFNNGAAWNMTGDSFVNNVALTNGGTINVQEAATKFNAEDVSMNDGVINMQGSEQSVNINNLSGTGVVNTESLENKMTIGKVGTGASLTVNGSGDIADAIYKGEATAQQLADVVQNDGTTAAEKVTTNEGIIAGRYRFNVNENGAVDTTNFDYTKNTKNEAISNMASIALMAWRAENNDMNKRLGELRNSNGEHGVWARMMRGESEYGAQSIKNQYNTYQLGYDEKLSTNDHWTVGAAISYTDGQSSFENGSGENTSKGLAFYGSYLGDNGEFVDLIAKYARLDNEFDVAGGVGSGDYSTNGYSFSAEYGKRMQLANDFYFEPQVELTYGKVADVDFVTENGAKVSQDSMDSLVGRVGFAAGKNIKNGNVYVRASYLYDFDGETNVTFSNAGASETFSEDLGGGWFEFGIGTNINLSDATYLYFDVEKTTGGEVDTNWQWNAGVRYSF